MASVRLHPTCPQDPDDPTASMIWIAHGAAGFDYFSTSWLAFRGRRLEEEAGRGWISGVHPDETKALQELLSSAFGEQKAFETRFRLRDRAGEFRLICFCGSPALVFSGEKLLFVGYAVDVSGQADAADRHQQLLRRHELILESAGEGILGLDDAGHHTFVNPEAARLLGFDAGELVGARSHELWHHSRLDGEPYAAEDCPIYSALRDGEVHRVTDDVFWRRDGTPLRVEYVSTPIREKGHLEGAVVVFRDVTKERRLEALAEAVESMNSLGYVFSAVRHELGNPVNSVKMALTVLRANLSRFGLHQVEQYLDRSLSELGRVEDLLSSLKSYSLYEDVSPGPLLLDRFVSDFVRVFGDDYRRRGIDLSLEAGVGDMTVFADPRALRQILLNLVANAVEAVAENERPVVRLVTAASAGGASLRVIDNGCGMTDEVLKNLFKPFHTTKAKGTGLGLVISSKMMARMEGLIDVDSRTGNGTILTLWFRLADPDR